MKNILFALVLFTGITTAATAQRYAYVDSEFILNNLPEYQAAQQELDRFSAQWQKEIEQRYEAIDRLYKAFQAEKVLLTDEMRTAREEEIVQKEQQARELQRQRFGVEGDLFQKRVELIQPIQDKVYQAIKEVAEGSGYSVIFDKANQSNILYADPRYDKSDRVLRKLGISSSDVQENAADEDEPAEDRTAPATNPGGNTSTPQRK